MGEDQKMQMKPSKRPSETLESLISLRLARLSAITGRAVEDVTRKVWINSLKFLMPQQIEAGFDRLESGFIPTAACPFPVPAHLLAVVAEAEENKEEIDAENAWSDLLNWMHLFYRPDCRDREYPLMAFRMYSAAQAAGGLEHISTCPMKELPWAKKRFIEAYLSLGKLEQDKPLLGSPEVMKQIALVAESKQLKGE